MTHSSWRPRVTRRRRVMHAGSYALAGCAALLLSVLTPGAASAASQWTGQVLPFPVTGHGLSISMTSVSCAAPGRCVAVGHYESPGVPSRPFAEVLVSGTWTYRALPLPAPGASATLTSVSCAAVDHCVAVGVYSSPSVVDAAYAETLAGSTWTATTLPLGAGQDVPTLDGVSCVATTACTAVGSVFTGLGQVSPLVETLTGTTWRPTALPSLGSSDATELTSVSCTSAASCVAVGGPDAGLTPIVARLSAGHWSEQRLPLIPGAAGTRMTGVSCVVAGCVAVGRANGVGLTAPVSYRPSHGTWTAKRLPTPGGTQFGELLGVDCASAGHCVAVGDDFGPDDILPLAETLASGTWTPTSAPLPAKKAGLLSGVSCTGPSSCVAVGIAVSPTGVIVPIADTLG